MYRQSSLVTLNETVSNNPKIKKAISTLLKCMTSLEQELLSNSKNYTFSKLVSNPKQVIFKKKVTPRKDDLIHSPNTTPTKKIALDNALPTPETKESVDLKENIKSRDPLRVLKYIHDNPGADIMTIAQVLAIKDLYIIKELVQQLCLEGSIFDSEGTYFHTTVLLKDSDSDDTNCNSMAYLPIKVTGAIMKILHGRVALLITGEDRKLTTEDLLELDGKTIQIKDPTKCLNDQLCATCGGRISINDPLCRKSVSKIELDVLEFHLLETLTKTNVKSKNFLHVVGSPASKYKSAIK